MEKFLLSVNQDTADKNYAFITEISFFSKLRYTDSSWRNFYFLLTKNGNNKNIGSIHILIRSSVMYHVYSIVTYLGGLFFILVNILKIQIIKTISLLERISFQSIKEYNPQYKVYGCIPTDSKVVFKTSMVSIQ